MRILVTDIGKVAVTNIKVSKDDDFPQHTIENYSTIKKTNTSASPKKKSARNKSPNNTKILNTDQSYSNLNDIAEQNSNFITNLNSIGYDTDPNLLLNYLGRNCQIKIKTNKIQIGRRESERYNNKETEGQSQLLPILNFQTDKNEESTHKGFANDYAIKDIIGKDKCEYLKKNMENVYNEKQKHSVINEKNFRTNAEEKNYLKRLDSDLLHRISSDKMNLINYLSKKSNISNATIVKVAHAKENQILKMNKACQINNHLINKDEIFQLKIQRTLVKKEQEISLEYKRKLQQMNNELLRQKTRLHSYEGVCFKNVDAYRYNFNNLKKKYWNTKINKLYNPKYKDKDDSIINNDNKAELVN